MGGIEGFAYERADRAKLASDLACAANPLEFLALVQKMNGFEAGDATSLCNASLQLLDIMGVSRGRVYLRLLEIQWSNCRAS